MQADVNNLPHARPGGQSPAAQFDRVQNWGSAAPFLLLFLFTLERRIASLQAAMEAVSTLARVPSPTTPEPRTSSGMETTPTSDAAEESASSERQPVSNDGGRWEASESVLGSRSVANATRRMGRRCRFCRNLSSPTPPVVDSTQGTTHVSETQEMEQEEPSWDGRFSQLDTANLFDMYGSSRLELRSEGQLRPHEGQFRDVSATESPSLTWTLTCQAPTARYERANEYVGEVFSPVSEVSGYLVKLYARYATKDGCAMLWFCAQLCANIDSHAVSRPFRGTLKFIIHHPTCPAKSRLYVVPALQEDRAVAISDVGKTLFSLTGPIPVMILHSEGLWAAESLRLSLSVSS
ncbi:hypothetical protein MTO96_050867 [Rhipicephalus appendiculatus]